MDIGTEELSHLGIIGIWRDDGEIDGEGPWKIEGGITVVESPALQEFQVLKATPKSSQTTLDSRRKSKNRR
jgi:hypothetical protein